MSIPKGPSEGGNGGKRGHSNMEHWGYSDEVKEAARLRRRIDDKKIVEEQFEDDDSHRPNEEMGNVPHVE